ncbi:MAG TPA: hypothetical protein VF071_12080, partial [Candidatus Limnocylindria bacterium]
IGLGHLGAVRASRVRPYTVFLVECFAPASGEEDPALSVERVLAECAGLRATGAAVTYLGALFMPDDELAFHLFMAADADGVLEVSRRADLRIERLVDGVAFRPGRGPAAVWQPLPVGGQVERPVAHEPGEICP